MHVILLPCTFSWKIHCKYLHMVELYTVVVERHSSIKSRCLITPVWASVLMQSPQLYALVPKCRCIAEMTVCTCILCWVLQKCPEHYSVRVSLASGKMMYAYCSILHIEFMKRNTVRCPALRPPILSDVSWPQGLGEFEFCVLYLHFSIPLGKCVCLFLRVYVMICYTIMYRLGERCKYSCTRILLFES